MSDQALVIRDKDDKEVLVVVFSNSRLNAAARPGSWYTSMAARINQQCADMTNDQCKFEWQLLVDAYGDIAWPYGGRSEVLDYSGKNKDIIDTIKSTFNNRPAPTRPAKET